MKVAIYTLGCKVNQYESNVIQNEFENNGYEVVNFDEFADAYIINTCTVTAMGDKKSRQILRRAKQINPNSCVCAIGCYAQVSKEDLEKIEEIDIILGTIEKSKTFEIVDKYIKENNHNKIVMSENIMKLMPYCEYNGVAYSEHVRAEIKIQDECDRFCSYCIIPYARGPVRSRKPEDIKNEVKLLVEKGIKEIVITGIHISSYGKDFKYNKLSDEPYDYKYGLIDLLEELNNIEGIERIRLGSLEPRIITEKFVIRLTKLNKVCNHFHLSLQSGCDETLARMNRKYSTTEFKEIVKLIRNNIKEVALTTDVIVGFPGETEEEFNKTVEFLKEIKFSKMHVFKYSKRKGTPAATMPNQVPEEIKEQRSNILLEMTAQNEKEFASQYIGHEIEVLFENDHEGHTSNYIKVILKEPNEGYINQIIKVIPQKYEEENLIV